jgi:hypothetical protein
MTAVGVTPLEHRILSGQFPLAKAPLVLGNQGAGWLRREAARTFLSGAASERGMIHTISSNCLSARLPELAGRRRYQYQLSRLRSVAGDGHTGRQYGGYWRSPSSPSPCDTSRVVVVGGGGAGSASPADLLMGYCRSLPSSSGGSVHSPRDRCAARAEATAANRKTQHGRRR